MTAHPASGRERPKPAPATATPSSGRRRARAGSEPLAPIPIAAGLVTGLLALLLLLAPPESNYFWALNGFRSLPIEARFVLLLAAAAASLPAVLRWRGRAWWWVLALALAAVTAFPLRERIHFLGDTQLRLRSLSAFGSGLLEIPFGDWSARLHASPLDIVVNLMGPLALGRAGLVLLDGVSWTCLLLALLYFAGLWRIAGRFGAGSEVRVALALALGLNGVLEAFAGYAESGALLAAAAAWWWAEMLAPLSGGRRALRVCFAWVVLLLSHRIGVVMLLPMAWRALGPKLEGDDPAGRRALLAGAVAIAALGAATLAVGGAGRQMARDAAELLLTLQRRGVGSIVPGDIANSLLLVGPLAILAPLVAGGASLAAFVRGPRFALAMTAVLPLLAALAWLFPIGVSGLGAHRDWDANVLLSVSLGVASAPLLGSLSAPRLRAALAWCLPVLALGAGGWVMVNADEAAAERRALAVVSRPPALPDAQRSHAYLFLGQRAMDLGEPALAAAHYQRAFELNPNPRRALLAAEAWAVSGNAPAARTALAEARANGPLAPDLERGARAIDEMIARLAPGSPGVATGAAAAGADSSSRAR